MVVAKDSTVASVSSSAATTDRSSNVNTTRTMASTSGITRPRSDRAVSLVSSRRASGPPTRTCPGATGWTAVRTAATTSPASVGSAGATSTMTCPACTSLPTTASTTPGTRFACSAMSSALSAGATTTMGAVPPAANRALAISWPTTESGCPAAHRRPWSPRRAVSRQAGGSGAEDEDDHDPDAPGPAARSLWRAAARHLAGVPACRGDRSSSRGVPGVGRPRDARPEDPPTEQQQRGEERQSGQQSRADSDSTDRTQRA